MAAKKARGPVELAVAAARKIGRVFYRVQIMGSFPGEAIERNYATLEPLDGSYELRTLQEEGSCAAMAALLNQEPGFGVWTEERVRNEIRDRLTEPNAAYVVFRDGKPIACGSVIKVRKYGRTYAEGMYLYVEPKYRKHKVGRYVTWFTLMHAVRAGYPEVFATTDPTRLSAIALYLAGGARPIYDCAWNVVRWYQIRKRLQPVLDRAARSDLRRKDKSVPQG